MGKEIIAVLVMLNNYFHDLAVAVLFCSVLVSWLVWRGLQKEDARADSAFFKNHIWQGLSMFIWGSLAWILVGGVIRAIAYQNYEWLPAAGRSQIPALIIKHVLLVSMVSVGLYLHLKMSRRISQTRINKPDPDHTSNHQFDKGLH
ncbi:hypothetical protein ACFLUU_09490 [Chloroflexota bacterium]